MTRIVYIGGFSGRVASERLQKALCTTFNAEDVDPFTFADAMQHPGDILRSTQGVEVFTHSAGMMALRFAMPERTHSFNPPLPSSAIGLIGRKTIRKTRRMFVDGYRGWGMPGVVGALKFTANSARELSLHPLGNFGLLGEIAATNAFEEAAKLARRGAQVTLAFTDRDEYFTPSPKDMANVPHRVTTVLLHGEHDELVLRPESFLAKYAASRVQ